MTVKKLLTATLALVIAVSSAAMAESSKTPQKTSPTTNSVNWGVV